MQASLFIAAIARGLAVHNVSADVLSKFQAFEAKWEKKYDIDERCRRLEIFADNLGTIEQLQRQHNGTATFSYLGRFADLSLDEFSARQGLSVGTPCQFLQAGLVDASGDGPDDFDWVAEGAVTPVKDQGTCANCWAHGAAAAVEGAVFLGTGELLQLSEQYLQDCDPQPHVSRPCCKCGGIAERSLTWLSNGNGLPLLSDYPYVEADHKCQKNVPTPAHIEGLQVVQYTSTEVVKAALRQYGPISFGMSTRWAGFQLYQGGIVDPHKDVEMCSDNANHVMTLVGYGVEGGVAYWKIKNSYSTAFGEQGYVRIIQEDVCGIGGCMVAALGGSVEQDSFV